MSETRTIDPQDREALAQAVADDAEVTVHFDGCPVPGRLAGVTDAGDLDVHVYDDDGRYEGDYVVAPRSVTEIALEG